MVSLSLFIRKCVIAVSLVGSGLIFCATVDMSDLLMRFLAIGEVPGTSIIVPSDVMLMMISLAVIAVLVSVVPLPGKQLSEIPPKPRMPRQRYSKI